MAQTHRGGTRITGRELGRAGQPGLSAHDLLDDDHNRVLQMFNEYENLKSTATPAEKYRLASAICRALTIHGILEEEIYYPRVRKKADIDDRVAAAEEDHAHMKELIREVEDGSAQEASFDAKMRVLDAAVREHISEERDGLFDVAEALGINTTALAHRLYARRQELLADERLR